MPRFLVLDRVQTSDGRRKGVIIKLDSYIPSDYRSQHYQVEWDSGARNWYEHYQLLPYTEEQEDLDNRLQASAAVAPPLPPTTLMAAPTRRTRRSAAQILGDAQAPQVVDAQRASDEYWDIYRDRILPTAEARMSEAAVQVMHMSGPEPPEMEIREVAEGWTGAEPVFHSRAYGDVAAADVELLIAAAAMVPVDQVQFSEVEYNDPTVW